MVGVLKTAVRSVLALDDRAFDLRYRVNTSKRISSEQLFGTEHPEASDYEPCRLLSLRVAFRLLRTSSGHFGYRPKFIDVGCGHGRACFYASKSRLFSGVVGVDLSADLVAQARRNQGSFRGLAPTFEVADAAEYRIGDEPTVVFLFNPFGPTILDRFCELNGSHRSPVEILYCNDLHRSVLEERGYTMLARSSSRNISLWRGPTSSHE